MNNKENSKSIKPRCSFKGCKKKLTILHQYECRCGLLYCIKHKLPELHDCKYNYKNDKVKLEKVVAEKIIKI